MRREKVVVVGRGWLGEKFGRFLGAPVSGMRIRDERDVRDVLEEYHPDWLINAIGETGKGKTIDACVADRESKERTAFSNTIVPWVVARTCAAAGVGLVHLSSGCIFDGPSPRPKGFQENDTPNPPSWYSRTKLWGEELVQRNYASALILRLRMPFDGVPHPRNLITKLANYQQVLVGQENSLTDVETFLGAAKLLMERNCTGTYNVVNPGPMRFERVMELYQEIVDPFHVYRPVTLEEFEVKGLAQEKRSNCVLDCRKLQEVYWGNGDALASAEYLMRVRLHEYRGALPDQQTAAHA